MSLELKAFPYDMFGIEGDRGRGDESIFMKYTNF